MEFQFSCVELNLYWRAFSCDCHLELINAVYNVLALCFELTESVFAENYLEPGLLCRFEDLRLLIRVFQLRGSEFELY